MTALNPKFYKLHSHLKNKLLILWRKHCSIYVSVDVSIFNVHARKAIQVESIVKTVRKEIQLE